MNKIVSERVIGSANPFAKFFRELAASIKGIFTGILLIIASFVVVYFAANQAEHAKTIESLALQTPEEVVDTEQMVKIHAVPTADEILIEGNSAKEVLYFNYIREEYSVKEERKTERTVKDGKEIEREYISYEPSWTTVENKTTWADFSLGEIAIDPSEAKLQMNTETLFEEENAFDYPSYKDNEDLVGVVQKERIKIKGVDINDELIVVGMLSNNKIASGNEDGTFFISNKSNQTLINDQKSSEKTAFWIKIFITWLMMTIGFTMLVGPITKILDIIPGVGELASGLVFIVFGILSAIIVFLAYVGIKFWWAILLAILAGIFMLVYKRLKGGAEVKHIEKTKKK